MKNNKKIDVWVIYKHPIDFPDKFVARKWVLDKPTNEVVIGNNLEEVRLGLPKGLTKFQPDETDDKHIIENWL